MSLRNVLSWWDFIVKKEFRVTWGKVRLSWLAKRNSKFTNQIKPNICTIRLCSLLLKPQKTHKLNFACFHGNGTIPSCIAVSHFPRSLGLSEASNNGETKLQYWEQWKVIIWNDKNWVSEFCNKIMYLRTWKGTYIEH